MERVWAFWERHGWVFTPFVAPLVLVGILLALPEFGSYFIDDLLSSLRPWRASVALVAADVIFSALVGIGAFISIVLVTSVIEPHFSYRGDNWYYRASLIALLVPSVLVVLTGVFLFNLLSILIGVVISPGWVPGSSLLLAVCWLLISCLVWGCGIVLSAVERYEEYAS